MEKLEVRHFGPIKELNIEIKLLTIFIGTQGSGKSTISKLLTICRDMHWYINILEKENELKPFIDFNIDEYFQEDTYIHYQHTGLDWEVEYNNGKFSIRIKDLSVERAKVMLNLYIKIANENLLEYSLRQDDKDVRVEEFNTKLMKAGSRLMLYIPAERNLVGNLSSALASIMLAQIPLSNTILEYMSLFEKAKKEFPLYKIPFLGVQFEKKEGKERIVLTGENKELPLNACSSGLQSVIPMIMVIDYVLKVDCFNSFVIEEPEQNLFPDNQCALLDFISSKQGNQEYPQFVITTHSPYLLSYLNVLMFAYKLHNIKSIREEVEKIVIPEIMINPEEVAVYGLNTTGDDYCKNLIAERTGLVSVNNLDSISEFIGDEYEQLYRLYFKTKRK
ncbi:AAA family ATPase [Hoylesella oralis]|uniref:AAA family ATPase n=1 Tax=Hoylesella oralis TaxID=28134 RepID=UPI0028EEB56E|nr:AAA family ATPase [Hoylesella oralis]